jgi:hypothetical protein
MADTYYCDPCNCNFTDKYSYERHITRMSHLKNAAISSADIYCKICNYTAKRLSNFKVHLKTQKHIKAELEYGSNLTKYICEVCNLHTNSKSDYISHINTKKHIEIAAAHHEMMRTSTDTAVSSAISTEITPVQRNDEWNNLIEYRDAISTTTFIEWMQQNKEFQKSIIEFCIKQNAEMQAHMMEFCKTVQNNTVIHNSNTNNTQNFNIQIFLNETCKDAVNISEFIESLKIDTTVIEYIGKEGYVDGMTKIFFDGLGQMEVCRRPIHCTDVKRETFYIRDDNKWMRDNDNNRIIKAINRIVRKNQCQLRAWREQNPRCEIVNTPEYEFHLKIMMQCIGGGMNKELMNNRKIIKNLAKFTMIEKSVPQLMDNDCNNV